MAHCIIAGLPIIFSFFTAIASLLSICSLAQITLLATLLSMAADSPLEKCGTFSVKQQLNPNFVANGPAVYAKAFLKYNKTMPHDLAVAVSNSGSVTAPTNPYDTAYLCPVNIDGQILNLDSDTGSADL